MGTIASSGSTIVVTAKTGRFRRRIAMGITALVLLLVAGPQLFALLVGKRARVFAGGSRLDEGLGR